MPALKSRRKSMDPYTRAVHLTTAQRSVYIPWEDLFFWTAVARSHIRKNNRFRCRRDASRVDHAADLSLFGASEEVSSCSSPQTLSRSPSRILNSM